MQTARRAAAACLVVQAAESSLQKFWLHGPTKAVDKRAQRTGFPPNYIHSLDSAHMMETSMECSAQGIAFAGGLEKGGVWFCQAAGQQWQQL